MTINVLFVCLGNICRSPTAHGVFQQQLNQCRLSGQVGVDSAGTAGWHIGRAPDPRSIKAAASQGYDIAGLRARQVSASDFARFDYIAAMDTDNLASLEALRPADYSGELALLLSYADLDTRDVPDPYYGGEDGFEQVIQLVEQASQGLLAHIVQQHSLAT